MICLVHREIVPEVVVGPGGSHFPIIHSADPSGREWNRTLKLISFSFQLGKVKELEEGGFDRIPLITKV